MNKYQEHFRKANSTAREAFKAYRKAEQAYKNAEARAKQYPQGRIGVTVDAEYLAKSARANADFLEAKEALANAKRNMDAHKNDFAAIRKALAADIAASNMVNPEQMDMQTLELLKSGILTGNEYLSMLQKFSGNPTMTRLIGKYAHDAAETISQQHGPGDKEASAMRIAEYQARTNTGEEVLQCFDVMQDAFSRSVNNPAMIDSWDSLTGDIMQTYGGGISAE